MDAIEYIRSFRSAARNRDASVTRGLVGLLRNEPWPTVALVCTRLLGVGIRGEIPDLRWFRDHNVADVLVEAHDKFKRSSRNVVG